MSHEIEPNSEPEGGPENDDSLPPAAAETTADPLAGDDSIPDEPDDDREGQVIFP